MNTGRPRRYATHAERQKAYRARQADACPTLQALLDAWVQALKRGEAWDQFIARTGAMLLAADQQLTALCRGLFLLVLMAPVAAEDHPQRPRGRQRQREARCGTDLRRWWEAHAAGEPFPDWASKLVRFADAAGPTLAARMVGGLPLEPRA